MPTPPLREPDHYRLHAEICKVLTEPKRLMLLDALQSGEASVGDLAAAIGISLSNASQHLAVMRGAGLVEGRRAGTTIRYRLAEPSIVEACRIIDRIIDRRLPAATPGPAAALDATARHSPPSSAASPADPSPQLARR